MYVYVDVYVVRVRDCVCVCVFNQKLGTNFDLLSHIHVDCGGIISFGLPYTYISNSGHLKPGFFS